MLIFITVRTTTDTLKEEYSVFLSNYKIPSLGNKKMYCSYLTVCHVYRNNFFFILFFSGTYQPSHDLMLRFYAYYKQASEGPCTASKPNFWEVVKKAKWDAWHKLGNMSREDAMNNYVEELKKVNFRFSFTSFYFVFVPYFYLLGRVMRGVIRRHKKFAER